MIVFSDLHLCNREEFKKPWIHGANSRLEWGLKVFEQIVKLAVEDGDESILSLGDFFHIYNDKVTPTVGLVVKYVAGLLEQYNKVLYLLVGNHEMPDKESCGSTALDVFEGQPRVKVIRDPQAIKLGDLKWFLVPYHKQFQWTKEQIDKGKSFGIGTIFGGHLDLEGAQASIDGYVCPLGISPEAFRGYKAAFLGHYHAPTDFTLTDGTPVQMLGSPMHHTRIDAGQTKRVLSIKIDNRNGQLYIKMYNPVAPEFVDISIDSAEDLQELCGLQKRDYHIIHAPSSSVKEVRAFLDREHLTGRVKAKPEVKAPVVRIKADMKESPLVQYVNYMQPKLHLARLIEIGQGYIDRGNQ